jgi:hypothetical protein
MHRPLLDFDSLDRLDPLRGRYARLLATLAVGRRVGAVDELADVLDQGDEVPTHRPFYAPLGRHARLTADQIRTGGVPREAVGEPHLPAQLSAGLAEAVCSAAWDALAHGRSLHPLAAKIRPTGAFLTFDGNAGDNPEPWWYAELVLLHAVTTQALRTGDPTLLDACRRSSAFHHAETQPDHATSEPLALHAFALQAETVPTADLMLLATGVNEPGELGLIPRLMLADAAVGLLLDPADR